MPHVYTTGSNDSVFTLYKKDENDVPQRVKQILIKGGSGVAKKNLVTPQGVHTLVSDEDMEFLLKNENFKKMMKAGFVKVDKKKVDPEIHAADMAQRDGSAPRVPEDFAAQKDGAQPMEVGRLKNLLKH